MTIEVSLTFRKPVRDLFFTQNKNGVLEKVRGVVKKMSG
ncbi:MAG: hypothetical protein JWO58_2523 [Chitinophagaceae bacterium]|nr:hypothetical protein [Chitinophagaceae bacterium]